VREQVGGERSRWLDACTRLDDRDRHLAPVVVGYAEHRRVTHRGMRQQRGLHLGGIDVHAARNDHVDLAVAQVEIALIVELTHVADGEVVAVTVGGGLLGIALVGELPHELEVHGADGAAWHLVAIVVEHFHVGTHPRTPDGTGMREPLLRTRQRATTLRRAVELVDHGTEPREQALLELDRARRGGVYHLPQRRHVVLGAHVFRQCHQPVQLGGHHGDVGDAVRVDQPERAFGVPLLHEHDRVLEGGEIVERGTHDELLAVNGRYRHLHDKQYKIEKDRFVNPGEDFTPELPKARPEATGAGRRSAL